MPINIDLAKTQMYLEWLKLNYFSIITPIVPEEELLREGKYTGAN